MPFENEITIGEDDILDITSEPELVQETLSPEPVSEHLLMVLDSYMELVPAPTPVQVAALAMAIGIPETDLWPLINSMIVADDNFGDVQSVNPGIASAGPILQTDLLSAVERAVLFTEDEIRARGKQYMEDNGLAIEEPMEFFVEQADAEDTHTEVDKEIDTSDDELVDELTTDGEDDDDEIDEFTDDGISDPTRKEANGA